MNFASFVVACAAVASILTMPMAAIAHSQLFLKAHMTMIASSEANVSEIRNLWRFEPASSASILGEFDRNSNGSLEDDERAEIATAIRHAASPFTIETHLVHNGRNVPLDQPSAVRVDYLGQELVINYSVKPKSPLRLKGHLALWLSDPKHNAVMDFWADSDLSLSGDAFEACERRVVRLSEAATTSRNQAIATEMFFNDPGDQRRPALTSTRLEVDCPR